MILNESIEVDVPASFAYARWIDLETFPAFMEGFEAVERIGEKQFRWTIRIGPARETGETAIVEAIPDRRVVWKSLRGRRTDGRVDLEPLTAASTRIHLRVDFEPIGVLELLGGMVGLARLLVRKDLENFKRYAESGRQGPV